MSSCWIVFYLYCVHFKDGIANTIPRFEWEKKIFTYEKLESLKLNKLQTIHFSDNSAGLKPALEHI